MQFFRDFRKRKEIISTFANSNEGLQGTKRGTVFHDIVAGGRADNDNNCDNNGNIICNTNCNSR